MGRGDNDDDLFGGLYSPYQRQILATQRADAVMAGPPAPNPLNTTSTIQPTATVEPSAPPVPNPLIQPAFPLSTMSPERQLRWQETAQQAQKAQADLNATLMAQEISRREEAHKAEIIRQSKELIDRSSELDPSDLKGYPLARAKLARDYPIGAGSEEVKRALAPLDEIHKQASGYETWYQKEAEKQGQTEQQKRLDDARKVVNELGPDAIADFYQTQKNEGTEAAIEKVTKVAGDIKQSNLIAQLKNAGLTEEQIQAKYRGGTTGEPFKYAAAEFEAKTKVNPELDYNRATANLLALQKQRQEARYDPNSAEPNPDWNDQMEAVYQGAWTNVNRLGARAGIQNFDPAKARAEKAQKDKEVAEAKARADQAKAGQPGYFGRLWGDLWNQPAVPPAGTPPAIPATTPTVVPGATAMPTPVPTPVPTATPVTASAVDQRVPYRLPDGRTAVPLPGNKWGVKRETK
jgi:hypothetical protein